MISEMISDVEHFFMSLGPLYVLLGEVSVQVLCPFLIGLFVLLEWKTVWNFLRKLKMELPFDPAIPLLGLYPKNPETPIQKNPCIPKFIAALFTIAKCWKLPKFPSVGEWIKKLVHLHNGILHSRKKEGAPTLCDRMDGTGEHYGKGNKPGSERQIP